MANGRTSLTAQNIQDAFGNLLPSGTLQIVPTDGNDVPIAAVSGQTATTGTGAWAAGGAILIAADSMAAIQITNGAIPAGTTVADTRSTSPLNISYRFTVCDPDGVPLYIFKGIQSPSDGSAINLDNPPLAVPPLAATYIGPTGPSAYQLAVTNGYTGTLSQWLASLANGPTLNVTAALQQAAAPAVRNIFDAAAVQTDVLISRADGTTRAYAGMSYASTGYMVVAPGQQYVASATTSFADSLAGWAWYDQNRTYLSGSPGVAAGTPVTAPSGAYYARVGFGTSTTPSITTVNVAQFAVYPAAALPAQRVPFVSAANFTGQSVGLAAALASLLDPTANVFVAGRATVGALQAANGVIGNFSDWFTSAYIPVAGISQIVANQSESSGSPYGWCFYDSNLVPLGSTAGVFPYTAGTAISVPAGAAFVRVTGHQSYISSYYLNLSGTLAAGKALPVGTYVAASSGASSAPATTTVSSALASLFGPRFNLFSTSRATVGYVLNGQTGVPQSGFSDWFVSDYIPVAGLSQLISNQSETGTSSPYGWAFYDATKTLVSASAMQFPYTKNTPVNVPAAAAYVRITGHASYQAAYVLNAGATAATGYSAAFGDISSFVPSRWNGKNYGAFGDSITASNVYQQQVAINLGMNLTVNDGCGGRGMVSLFSDSCFTAQLTQANVQALDLITIFLGTNDYGGNTAQVTTPTPLGNLSDTSVANGFYGAIDQAINTILGWNPLVKLVFLTPIYRKDKTGANSAGLNLVDYVNALQTKCALYAVPVIDLFRNSGYNTLNIATYSADNLHPSPAGHAACTIPLITAGLARL